MDDETRRLGAGQDGASPRPSSPDGQALSGRYALRALLGQGGMADVRLAHDLQLDRQVAVKMLHARYADDPAFLTRFHREAQAVANLNHPNIVGVYDFGEDEGRPYIVMEYVAGRSLRDVLRRESITPQRALEIVGDAARGLDYAHDRGLIHRDIKPGNILVSDTGQVKVADFGIARAVNAETVTQTAAVFGTAAYVAPEQAQGNDVDRRSDVYSLGCVLYELLTGNQPFTADSPVALAYKHVSETPAPPSQLSSDVSDELDAVVLKAMAKDPADRYQTAREFSADLQRVDAGMPVNAPPAAAWAAATQVIDRDRTAVVAPPRREEYYEYDDYEEQRPARRRLGWAILALVVLGVFVLAGILLADLLGSPTLNRVEVPDVTGLPLVEAQNILEGQGFEPRVADERVASAEFEENEVVSTDPEPQAQVPEGSVVTMTLSQGPPLVMVPELEGQTEEEAQATLTQANLGVGERRAMPSDEFRRGIVISSDPPAGEEVAEGSDVAIVVSSGPENVAVPEVVGQTEEQARTNLAEACDLGPDPCLTASVTEESNEEVEPGVVFEQEPAPGQDVPVGSDVALVVSSGPQVVEVPSVVSLPEDQAIGTLQGACEPQPCLDVTVERQFNASVPEGDVVSQAPEADTEVQAGSDVTIVVSRGPESTPTPTPEPTPTPTVTPTLSPPPTP